MRQTFSPFGQIMEIRVFPDKGYSFVRYVDVSYLLFCLFSFKQGQSVVHKWLILVLQILILGV